MFSNDDLRFDVEDDDVRIVYDVDDAEYEDDEYYDEDYDDGQPDEMLEWEGLADAGYGTDEDYGYYGDEGW